jgi:hypothetical protein
VSACADRSAAAIGDLTPGRDAHATTYQVVTALGQQFLARMLLHHCEF